MRDAEGPLRAAKRTLQNSERRVPRLKMPLRDEERASRAASRRCTPPKSHGTMRDEECHHRTARCASLATLSESADVPCRSRRDLAQFRRETAAAEERVARRRMSNAWRGATIADVETFLAFSPSSESSSDDAWSLAERALPHSGGPVPESRLAVRVVKRPFHVARRPWHISGSHVASTSVAGVVAAERGGSEHEHFLSGTEHFLSGNEHPLIEDAHFLGEDAHFLGEDACFRSGGAHFRDRLNESSMRLLTISRQSTP